MDIHLPFVDRPIPIKVLLAFIILVWAGLISYFFYSPATQSLISVSQVTLKSDPYFPSNRAWVISGTLTTTYGDFIFSANDLKAQAQASGLDQAPKEFRLRITLEDQHIDFPLNPEQQVDFPQEINVFEYEKPFYIVLCGKINSQVIGSQANGTPLLESMLQKYKANYADEDGQFFSEYDSYANNILSKYRSDSYYLDRSFRDTYYYGKRVIHTSVYFHLTGVQADNYVIIPKGSSVCVYKEDNGSFNCFITDRSVQNDKLCQYYIWNPFDYAQVPTIELRLYAPVVVKAKANLTRPSMSGIIRNKISAYIVNYRGQTATGSIQPEESLDLTAHTPTVSEYTIPIGSHTAILEIQGNLLGQYTPPSPANLYALMHPTKNDWCILPDSVYVNNYTNMVTYLNLIKNARSPTDVLTYYNNIKSSLNSILSSCTPTYSDAGYTYTIATTGQGTVLRAKPKSSSALPVQFTLTTDADFIGISALIAKPKILNADWVTNLYEGEASKTMGAVNFQVKNVGDSDGEVRAYLECKNGYVVGSGEDSKFIRAGETKDFSLSYYIFQIPSGQTSAQDSCCVIAYAAGHPDIKDSTCSTINLTANTCKKGTRMCSPDDKIVECSSGVSYDKVVEDCNAKGMKCTYDDKGQPVCKKLKIQEESEEETRVTPGGTPGYGWVNPLDSIARAITAGGLTLISLFYTFLLAVGIVIASIIIAVIAYKLIKWILSKR